METVPDFLVKLEKVSGENEEEFAAFRKEFIQKICHLLDNQPDKLFNFFYRFDLDENQVKEAVFGLHSSSCASILCDLIIKRALEKIEMRKKYR